MGNQPASIDRCRCLPALHRCGLRPQGIPRWVPRWGDLVQLDNQRPYVHGGYLPDQLVVDMEVVMNDAMTHSNNILPRNLRMRLPKRFRDVPCGLPDHLDQMCQRELQILVLIIFTSGSTRCSCRYRTCNIEHVTDIHEVILLHTAPRRWTRIRSRRRGFRHFSRTISTLRPPNNCDNSSSMSMMPNPTRCPGSNSTNTSTSLSGPKSSRSTDPNSDSLRMWCRRQKSATASGGGRTPRSSACASVIRASFDI